MLAIIRVFSILIVASLIQSCGSPSVSRAKLPAQLEDFGVSVNAFRSTLWPILRQNCGTCHASDGLNRAPLHGDSDPEFAHDILLGSDKVSLTNPSQSRIYRKLKDEGHNCWTNCSADSEQILQKIKDWVSAGGTKVAGNYEDPSLLTSEVQIPAALAAFAPTPANGVAPALTSMKFDLSPFLGGTAATAYFEVRISAFDDNAYRIDTPKLVAPSGAYVKGVHIIINGLNVPENSTYRAVDRDVPANFNDSISSGAMLMLKDKGPGQDKLTIGFNVLSTSSDPYSAAFSVAKAAFQNKCVNCHAVGSANGDLTSFFDGDSATERDFASYTPIRATTQNYIAANTARAFVVPGDPLNSAFFFMIDGAPSMKTQANPDLTASEIAAFRALIQNYRP
jgi:hypothetical protein